MSTPPGNATCAKVLLAASFDPWTRGHEALLRAAVARFKQVVVAPMTDDSRSYVLPLQVRAALAAQAVSGLGLPAGAVEVVEAPGSTIVEAVIATGCDGVIRGSRGPQDLEVEERRRQCAADLLPGLGDRWFIWTPEDAATRNISATRVRDAMHNGVFLPDSVAPYWSQAALRYYMRGERVYLVVGESWDHARRLCRGIVEHFSIGDAPVATQVLPMSRLLLEYAVGAAPPWRFDSSSDALAYGARRFIGKARPSIRLLCLECNGEAPDEALLRACHGSVVYSATLPDRFAAAAAAVKIESNEKYVWGVDQLRLDFARRPPCP